MLVIPTTVVHANDTRLKHNGIDERWTEIACVVFSCWFGKYRLLTCIGMKTKPYSLLYVVCIKEYCVLYLFMHNDYTASLTLSIYWNNLSMSLRPEINLFSQRMAYYSTQYTVLAGFSKSFSVDLLVCLHFAQALIVAPRIFKMNIVVINLKLYE